MSVENRAKVAIEQLVSRWTKKYLYHITFLEKHGGQLSYMVEFSLPTSEKPIPTSTVQIQLKYRFEKDSLIHMVGKSIRETQMEQWIETFLLKKSLTRQNVFYLGTEYEVTRVKDARQDRILAKKVEEQQPEYMYIAPQLLIDQKRNINIMETKKLSQDHLKLMREQFYALDKDRLGVISQQQFIQLLKNMGLRLNTVELEDLVMRADINKTGLIELKDFQRVAEELSKGLIARDDSKNRMKDSEEEYEIESIMMLLNEQAHHIGAKMFQKFKKIDEDQHGFVKMTDVKKVLEEINVQSITEQQIVPPSSANNPPPARQQQKGNKKPEKVESGPKQPLLTIIEITQFIKRLNEKYMYNEVKYQSLHKQLIDYKLETLKKGLIMSNLNNLEVYLRELFEPYDRDKFGIIHLNDMLLAFMKSDKIILTRGQRYVLRSVIDRDEKEMVNYKQNSKQIAQLLKRFYLTCDCKRDTHP